MYYTQVKADTFETLQMNAGILVDEFTPSTGVIGNILGATSGGLSFASNPTYVDFGEDIDNCPANTWQLKRVQSYDPVISSTFRSITAALAKRLNGGAVYGTTGSGSSATTDETHVIPTHTLTEDDFTDFWVVGDYSDKNDGAGTAGFVAIHIMNAMNTAGFQMTTGKNDKGNFPFELHGHYDYEDVDTVPFEIYIKAGTSAG